MLCEHGNIAGPCVECGIEPLRAENDKLREKVAELVEGIARCRYQASWLIGNEEELRNQLSKVRDIANEVLKGKGAKP